MSNLNLRRVHQYEREGKLTEALALLNLLEQNPATAAARPVYKMSRARIEARLKTVSRTGKQSCTALPSGPRVSVVIPCFNAERLVSATLESVQTQTLTDFECILIDDHSIDGTAQLLREWARRDTRFRFVQHRANGGLAAARNTGIRYARAKYVCFLDADDLLSPSSLQQRADALDSWSNTSHVAGVYDMSTTIAHDHRGAVEAAKCKPSVEYVDFVSLQGDCPFNANQPMILREVLLNAGGFPERYPQAEDWRLWSKILRAGYLFCPVARVGSGYRQTEGSMIRRRPLLHVEKSKVTYFMAHAAVDAPKDSTETRYEESFFTEAYFGQAAGLYRARRDFIRRVVNFLGIEYARRLEAGQTMSTTELESALRSAEEDPVLSLSGYSEAQVASWFESGMRRYQGVSVSTKTLVSEARAAMSRLLNALGVTDAGAARFPSGSLVAPRKTRMRPSRVVDIAFLPHKDYHSRSFALLLPFLGQSGLSSLFVDLTVAYRQERARLPELDGSFLSLNEFILSRFAPRMLVCMNDWDTVVKPLVKCANRFGIPTVGIVEGVQDYHDEDTGRKRNPYREVRHVLLPGEFDRKYFADSEQQFHIAGVQRLGGLEPWVTKRRARATTGLRQAVVNLNFSYGVLTDARDQWLDDIASACAASGYEMVVSQHPQDDGKVDRYRLSGRPLYDLLAEADVFISRFSGAILESLAIGCPVIYYNGHREKVDKFHDPKGAYAVATNVIELSQCLSHPVEPLANRDEFLNAHAALGAGDPVERTATILGDILSRTATDEATFSKFKGALLNR